MERKIKIEDIGAVGVVKRDVFKRFPNIENVIFNNPATIVFWSDGSKTVVKCAGDEAFDEEKGLAMAISKKVLGNKGNYFNEFKKWLPEIEEDYGPVPFDNMVEGVISMTKYVVTITETLERQVTVEANDGDQALAKVRQWYDNSDIVLNADDFTDVVFGVECAYEFGKVIGTMKGDE